MQNILWFYILLAILFSIVLAFFQYVYKSKRKNKITYLLAFLRFISIFGLLLLLINPKFKKNNFRIEKPNLVILVDNSKSIKNTKQVNQITNLLEKLKTNKELKNKFKIKTYSFSDDLSINNAINFNKPKTNIYKSLNSAEKLFNKTVSPIVLMTDGKQTQGLSYANFKSNKNIYPIIIGDTTVYQDLKIAQLNINKYAYLMHKFPVEVFVNYQGNKKRVDASFTIKKGKQTIFSKKIIFKNGINSKHLNFYLPANSVGIHNYKASISILTNEKNRINNTSNFSVEVINEQSKILLISSISHPDIGMLKRSIESSKQRKLIIKKPTDKFAINDYSMFVLYQPNQKFENVFKKIKQFNKNYFIITGTKTNWSFLNKNQSYFKKNAIKSTQDYLANFNPSFSTYLTDNLGFNDFSPIQDYFGDVTFSVTFESLLLQQLGNFSSENPLFAILEDDNSRVAVLFGENTWRWRMSSYVEKKSFQPFDEFINNIIQYLSSTKRSDFLELKYKPYYYANSNVKINASFYDANYKFNAKANLWIAITNKATKKEIKYPFALQTNNYQVNISNLKHGNYTFKVFDADKKNTKYGKFIILPYDIEDKYIGTNKKELLQLANNTNGTAFYTNQFNELKTKLLQNKNYKFIQKSKEKITPLIDWYWLLAIIALSLSIEWFIRKYKGFL